MAECWLNSFSDDLVIAKTNGEFQPKIFKTRFFALVSRSPTHMGLLSVNNSFTNVLRLGTSKENQHTVHNTGSRIIWAIKKITQ